MAQQIINVGAAPNDGTGDPLRDAMIKANDNFTELYGDFASLGTAAFEDYEEGAWTPAFTFTTPGNQSLIYSQQVGRYVRIGKKVFATVRLFGTATHTTASGVGRVTGLPFAGMSSPAATNYSQVFIGGAAVSYPASRYVSGLLVVDGSSQATFNVGGPGAALVSLDNTNIASGSEFRVQGVIIYEIV